MDSRDLSERQLDELFKQLGPMTLYVCRLRDRMAAQGWPESDELYVLACRAHDALHRLGIHTHYLACDRAGKQKRPRETRR